MKDGIIKGNGNSRYLKSVPSFLSLYPTYEAFAEALMEGTLPVDFNGLNDAGWTQKGTSLNKASLLTDTTAQAYGLDEEATPDDAFQKNIDFQREVANKHLWLKGREQIKYYSAEISDYNAKISLSAALYYTIRISDSIKMDEDTGFITLVEPITVKNGYVGNNGVTQSWGTGYLNKYVELSYYRYLTGVNYGTPIMQRPIYYSEADTIQTYYSSSSYYIALKSVTPKATVLTENKQYILTDSENTFDTTNRSLSWKQSSETISNYLVAWGTDTNGTFRYGTDYKITDAGAYELSGTISSHSINTSDFTALRGKYVKPNVGNNIGGILYIPEDATISMMQAINSNLGSTVYYNVVASSAIWYTFATKVYTEDYYTYLGQLGDCVRATTGSYIGNGTLGANSPNKIFYKIRPKFIIVYGSNSYNILLVNNVGTAAIYNTYSIAVKWTDTEVSWYTSDATRPAYQLNESMSKYTYYIFY